MNAVSVAARRLPSKELRLGRESPVRLEHRALGYTIPAADAWVTARRRLKTAVIGIARSGNQNAIDGGLPG